MNLTAYGGGTEITRILLWVTIPENMVVESPLQKKEYAGGLYAAHTIIFGDFEKWHWLWAWLEASDKFTLNLGDPECMDGLIEEHFNYFNQFQYKLLKSDEVIVLNNLIFHYNSLIDEKNDPYRDPPNLQTYMNKWDGSQFINALMLNGTETVLEIGIGTGRIATKTAPLCKKLVGIDISNKTIIRAKENLEQFKNITYLCGDFLEFNFFEQFDVIYSSLTFLHIEEKQRAIEKIAYLLSPFGRAVISLDKNQDDTLDFGNRKLKVFPDTPQEMTRLFTSVDMNLKQHIEIEFANIIVATK